VCEVMEALCIYSSSDYVNKKQRKLLAHKFRVKRLHHIYKFGINSTLCILLRAPYAPLGDFGRRLSKYLKGNSNGGKIVSKKGLQMINSLKVVTLSPNYEGFSDFHNLLIFSSSQLGHSPSIKSIGKIKNIFFFI